MHNTAERVNRVQLRAKELHKTSVKRQIAGLGLLSGILVFFLFGAVYALTGELKGGILPSLCGAMLLYENAGGYVLAAVLSFAAAVVITVFCIRHRQKVTKKDDNRGR